MILTRFLARVAVAVAVTLVVLLSALAFDTATGDAASSTAPCVVRATYSGLSLSCYGAPATPLRGRGQRIDVPAAKASDRRPHAVAVLTQTPTVVSLQLDVNGRPGDVVCASAWGFGCRYSYR